MAIARQKCEFRLKSVAESDKDLVTRIRRVRVTVGTMVGSARSAVEPGWAPLDGEQTARLVVVDLQRGVVDAEALREELLQLFADLVAVVARSHEDVGRSIGPHEDGTAHARTCHLGRRPSS